MTTQSTQARNGKAFEWAVGKFLADFTSISILDRADAKNAQKAFASLTSKKQTAFTKSAEAAVVHILKKEFGDNDSYVGNIVFNPDSAGRDGDVRDLIVTINERTIGISCKNNHEAFKHSRLSGKADFVKKWGIDPVVGCSQQYWNTIKPLFNALTQIKQQSNKSALWSEIENKAGRFYWPILNAWAGEIERISNENAESEKEVSIAIIRYLTGRYDFYKIMREKEVKVNIQAYNFNKSLATKQTKYPSCIIAINDKNGGQYSKTITFNHGWCINFRIHSASSRVESSLKFDIKAIGLPSNGLYQQSLDV